MLEEFFVGLGVVYRSVNTYRMSLSERQPKFMRLFSTLIIVSYASSNVTPPIDCIMIEIRGSIFLR